VPRQKRILKARVLDPIVAEVGRVPRIQVAGGLYHVTTRGNRGTSIYSDDLDRLAFLDRLGLTANRFEWDVLSYCLMGNHFHLEIQTTHANIAAGMRALNGWYAQRFNARHDVDGHLFGRPYHAEFVEREAHLLEVARYIVRNPVRAGLCDRPGEWRWSSHRAVLGLARAPAWLRVEQLLAPFGGPDPEARERYRAFVEAAIDA
jgi:REP element-mobilizing transposase RayT